MAYNGRFVRQFAFAELEGGARCPAVSRRHQITYRLALRPWYPASGSRHRPRVLRPNHPSLVAYQLSLSDSHLRRPAAANAATGVLSPPEQIAKPSVGGANPHAMPRRSDEPASSSLEEAPDALADLIASTYSPLMSGGGAL